MMVIEHKAAVTHQELLSGIVASSFVNHSFSPPTKPVAPAVFMPSQWDRKEARPARVKQPSKKMRESIANNIRAFVMARASRVYKGVETPQ